MSTEVQSAASWAVVDVRHLERSLRHTSRPLLSIFEFRVLKAARWHIECAPCVDGDVSSRCPTNKMDVVRLRAAETCSCSSSAPRTRGWQSRGSSSQLVPARSFRSSAKPPFQLHAARRRDRAVLAAAADAEGHRTISASPTEGKGLGVLRAENSPWDDSTSAEGAVAAVKVRARSLCAADSHTRLAVTLYACVSVSVGDDHDALGRY